MGRAPDPNAEELEFIFQKFAEGLDDREVLTEIEDSPLPRRNRRFIYQRRLHWNAAKKILEVEIKRKLDPVIVEKRREHFALLKEMTMSLLHGKLDSVETSRSAGADDQRYLVGDTGSMTELSREQLTDQLIENEERTRAAFTDRRFAEQFVPHVTYENDAVAAKGWNKAIKESPYEVIKTLRLLVDRGTFNGICTVCEEWK